MRRQFHRISQKLETPKGKRERVVPCPPELAHELKLLLKARKYQSYETIFQNEYGKPVCHDNFSDRVFGADIAAWGGRKIRFHDMRHTAITLLMQSRVDLKTVKEIGGHADVKTTMKYSHMLAKSIDDVAETFSIGAAKPGEVMA